MSSNIKTTNFVSKINNAILDLAYLTTAWSNVEYGNRILQSAGDGAYYFPAPFQGSETAIYGQVVTIFNPSNSNEIKMNTGNMSVYFGSTRYGTFQRFNIPKLTLVRFVLLYSNYYVEMGRSGM
jgi:hypothetical protein